MSVDRWEREYTYERKWGYTFTYNTEITSLGYVLYMYIQYTSLLIIIRYKQHRRFPLTSIILILVVCGYFWGPAAVVVISPFFFFFFSFSPSFEMNFLNNITKLIKDPVWAGHGTTHHTYVSLTYKTHSLIRPGRGLKQRNM